MGAQDRNRRRGHHSQKPQNPDWQSEYARWYGRPNTPTPRQRVHWTVRLLGWLALFCIAHLANRYLGIYDRVDKLFVPAPPPVITQTTPEPKAPQRPETQKTQRPLEPAITISNASKRVDYRDPPAPVPQPQQAGIDPYTAELARQADARIARQNVEAQAQQVVVQQHNVNAGRCAQLANDRNIITEWLRMAGSGADRARFQTLLQVNQSDMARYGC